MQRYTSKTINALGGKGTASDNEVFFIADSDAGVVYAAGAVPTGSVSTGNAIQVGNKSYQGYKSKPFFQDCLHTAEEINKGKKLARGRCAVWWPGGATNSARTTTKTSSWQKPMRSMTERSTYARSLGTNMDASARNTAGTYAMYATPGGTGDTFHRTWKTSYFNKKTVNTIVIKPK